MGCTKLDNHIPSVALAHAYIVRSGVDNITFQTSCIRTSPQCASSETFSARRKIRTCCKMCLRARVLTAGEKIEGDSDSEWGSIGACKPETMYHQTKKSG